MLVLNMMSNSGSKIKILICCTKRGVVLHCCHCVWLSMALNSNSFSSWSSKEKKRETRVNWMNQTNVKQTVGRESICTLVSLSVSRSIGRSVSQWGRRFVSQSESQLVNQPRRWNLINRVIEEPANRRENNKCIESYLINESIDHHPFYHLFDQSIS